MTCAPVKSLLEPYLDEELDAVQRAQVAEHLAACGSCAEMHARLLELRTAIRAHAPYYRAPDGLRDQRIRFSLRQADRPAAATSWRADRHRRRHPAIGFGRMEHRPDSEIAYLARRRFDRAATSCRATCGRLMGAHSAGRAFDPTGTPSSLGSTASWTSRRTCETFSAQGYPADRRAYGLRGRPSGGRVLVLPAAASTSSIVFTWPSNAAGGRRRSLARNGYQAVRLEYRDGMAYWAVSDIELRRTAAV
jgi:anti-sigma factor RsiW